MKRAGRIRILIGVALDLAGAVLIVTSLPAGGVSLTAGIAALVVGSIMVVRGVLETREAENKTPRSASVKRKLAGWAPEPELAAPPPRPVRLNRTGRLLALLWASAIAGILAFLYLAPTPPAPESLQIKEAGVKTEGKVHRKTTRETASGETAFYLYYNFSDAEGNRVRSSIRVSESAYRSHEVDDPVEVVYVPEDAVSNTAPDLALRPSSFWMDAVSLAIIGVMSAVAYFHSRRHRKLTVHGAAAPAVVESASRRGSSRLVAVKYQAQGQDHTLQTTERRTSLQQGDVLTVLYLPEKPDEAIIYRQSLFRALAPGDA